MPARAFGVNVLVNNAGIGGFGLFEHQDWRGVVAVPMRLTHALLPTPKACPQAAVVNIGSTFGSLPFPGFAAYSAAKAGLRGFSQALRRERADTPVAVIRPLQARWAEIKYREPANRQARQGGARPPRRGSQAERPGARRLGLDDPRHALRQGAGLAARLRRRGPRGGVFPEVAGHQPGGY